MSELKLDRQFHSYPEEATGRTKVQGHILRSHLPSVIKDMISDNTGLGTIFYSRSSLIKTRDHWKATMAVDKFLSAVNDLSILPLEAMFTTLSRRKKRSIEDKVDNGPYKNVTVVPMLDHIAKHQSKARSYSVIRCPAGCLLQVVSPLSLYQPAHSSWRPCHSPSTTQLYHN